MIRPAPKVALGSTAAIPGSHKQACSVASCTRGSLGIPARGWGCRLDDAGALSPPWSGPAPQCDGDCCLPYCMLRRFGVGYTSPCSGSSLRRCGGSLPFLVRPGTFPCAGGRRGVLSFGASCAVVGRALDLPPGFHEAGTTAAQPEYREFLYYLVLLMYRAFLAGRGSGCFT
jgi:hypothetical protein